MDQIDPRMEEKGYRHLSNATTGGSTPGTPETDLIQTETATGQVETKTDIGTTGD